MFKLLSKDNQQNKDEKSLFSSAPASGATQRTERLGDFRTVLAKAERKYADKRITELIVNNNLKLFATLDAEIYMVEISNKDQDRLKKRTALSEIKDRLEEQYKKSPKIFYVEPQAYQGYVEHAEEAKRGNSKDNRTENEIVVDLLEKALNSNCSDIHILVTHEATIGFRVNKIHVLDHVMHAEAGTKLIRAIVQGANFGNGTLSEDSPTDVRFTYKSRGKHGAVTVRVNTVPDDRGGRKLVARLRKATEIVPLEKLGYSKVQMFALRKILKYSFGMMIVSGPVNSGKSTTTTACLNTADVGKIVAEFGDPIEAHLPRVVHVNVKSKLPGESIEAAESRMVETYKVAMRQDTDWLSITEIRSNETARFAADMAAQGLKFFSTLHVPNAFMIPDRLELLGLSLERLCTPGLFNGMVNQVLVPRLCDHCKKDHTEDHKSKYYEQLIKKSNGRIRYRNPSGCPKCNHSGISSTLLCAEVFPIGKEERELLLARDKQGLAEHYAKQGLYKKEFTALKYILAGIVDPSMAEDRQIELSVDVLTEEHLNDVDEYKIYSDFNEEKKHSKLV